MIKYQSTDIYRCDAVEKVDSIVLMVLPYAGGCTAYEFETIGEAEKAKKELKNKKAESTEFKIVMMPEAVDFLYEQE